MIKIKKTNDIISIRGHAEFAEPGKDIVCSAISTLTYTFIYSVEDLTEDKIEYDISDGIVIINIKDLTEASKLLLSSFLYGCRMVADNFPNNVQVSEH